MDCVNDKNILNYTSPSHNPFRGSFLLRSSLFLSLLMASLISNAKPQKSETDFPLEHDHILIWVKGAPEAIALQQFGFTTDGKVHQHRGQGTSSISFYFNNAALELIWIDDEDIAAKKDIEIGNQVLSRYKWRETGASPFGVGLRRRADIHNDIPFPTQKYRADWMQPKTYIEFAISSPPSITASAATDSSSNNALSHTVIANEPMYFVVPDYMASPSAETWLSIFENNPELQKLFVHPIDVKNLTNVEITINNVDQLSPTASLLTKNGIVQVMKGDSHRLLLTFDDGLQGKMLDVRPILPVLIKY
ncbi:hypothetical protein MK852_08775 [Shewanella benthica]|uniref:hypothetical protein n=1 Tax=Shewanella benthica TaxID=43661 RepID=UPI00187A6189|nr:hypothetical protein [Shewanella benthica]MBE7215258.1 hypothetical protein [Shewanella benthica]MCL1062227.1 hypothetical protein [Shewanella benthica]